MNIIIPLAGKGERFRREGHKLPKPLIPVSDKRIINHVIDHFLGYSNPVSYFVFYNDTETADYISQHYPNIHMVQVGETRGAAETLYRGITVLFETHKIKYRSTLVVDCDTVYTLNISNMYNHGTNAVFYTHDDTSDPIYSYIKLDENDKITEIKEKVKISDNANTGAYAFSDARILLNYCANLINNVEDCPPSQSGLAEDCPPSQLQSGIAKELFTSRVIDLMIRDGHTFKGIELPAHTVISLGIPSAVNLYREKCHYFMFDLDGTLVITDDLYFEVWTQILSNYGIKLTRQMYASIIQGNTDEYVMKQFLLTDNISGEKDRLFLLHMYNNVKAVPGAQQFVQNVYEHGHRICVVTNCNRSVATALIDWLQITHYVDFIVASGDSSMGKPSGEPYILAMNKYGVESNKCIIFEDSKTGLLSAKHASPKLIIGLTTVYGPDDMPDTDFTIPDYTEVVPTLFTDYVCKEYAKIYRMICRDQCSPEQTATIRIDSQKLKGGFIADVISYTVADLNGEQKHLVLKYENTHETGLTVMAKQLRLYEREYWFYSNISPKLEGIISVPKFANFVYDYDEGNTRIRGICLENMIKSYAEGRFRLNLDLNKEPIELTLKIVDRMAKLHSLFWNKTTELPGERGTGIYNSMDAPFCPFIGSFIRERVELFRNTWYKLLSPQQALSFDNAILNVEEVQRRMGEGEHLTFIHGDIKSPNIFYDSENDNEPCFLDWQHCAIGKGVQDLVFFVMESFCAESQIHVWPLAKERYFNALNECGISGYTAEQYEKDIQDAIGYIPLFTAIWFGTVPQDELIDKNFPHEFIMKLAIMI